MNIRDYCVYVHKDCNDKIFYIGSGTEKRPSNKTKRTKQWVEKSNSGWYCEVVVKGLTKEESIDLEQILLDKFRLSGLVNKVGKAAKTKRIPDDLLKQVAYSEDSITGLIDLKTNKPIGTLKTHKDSSKKYWTIRYKQSNYMCHRVVAHIFNGDITDFVVDHLDGDGLNNKINNLRLTDNKGNSKNTKSVCEALLCLVNKKGEKPYIRLRFLENKKQKNFYFRSSNYTDPYFCALYLKYLFSDKLLRLGYPSSIFQYSKQSVLDLWKYFSDNDKACLSDLINQLSDQQ